MSEQVTSVTFDDVVNVMGEFGITLTLADDEPIGSANLNARSLSWDYEENAVILDKCTTQQLDNLFDSEKKDCFYLTEKTWKAWRTPWQRARGWFSHLLAPFL